MIELKPEKIKINKETVLKMSGCMPDSPVHATVSAEYDKYCANAENNAKILIDITDENIYVILSAGEKLSALSSELMNKGECLAGLLVNSYADETVFSLDKIAADYIKKECALKGKGISQRIEISPESENASEFAGRFADYGIGITSSFMLLPEKTMGYILKLTNDTAVFKAQHDCSQCSNTDCPLRSVIGKKFDIVSDYGADYGETGKCVLGIDIGTTTLAFCMIKSNGEKEYITEMNPQRRFGADVISRLEAANAGRSRELHGSIVLSIIKAVNKLIADGHEIPEKAVISGNTVMSHLLLDYPLKELGTYPFKPYSLKSTETDFHSLTKNNSINMPVDVIGGISAFVGGDIVSGLYMCDFHLSDKINLFIDLGTNGEMAIGNRDKILVTSAAAGPAFEGGRISCGTGSVDGAVCGFDIKSGEIKTINNKPPCGICGTGVIEVLSELILNNIADNTGLLNEKYFDTGYPVTEGIYFTQKDIREIQMAKSAICSGIEILTKKFGVTYDDIDTVYLAGGFGYYLNPEKSAVIGLIPKEFSKKVTAVGNSSLGGALKYAIFGGKEEICAIQSISEEFPLADDEAFNALYLKNMYF